MRLLVTGGLGFIFHSDDGALRRLDPRVKGIIGDVPNSDDVARALPDVDAVVHPVALTGVGQSIYELDRYVDVNCRGTTTQLNGIVRQESPPPAALSWPRRAPFYGEGACAFAGHGMKLGEKLCHLTIN